MISIYFLIVFFLMKMCIHLYFAITCNILFHFSLNCHFLSLIVSSQIVQYHMLYFVCNLFIFPRTDLYLHVYIYTRPQYTKSTMYKVGYRQPIYSIPKTTTNITCMWRLMLNDLVIFSLYMYCFISNHMLYFFFVICLFSHEQIYTYILLYTQGLSTHKLQCTKLVVKAYCFVITFEVQS
jgi:hypothetical protein